MYVYTMHPVVKPVVQAVLQPIGQPAVKPVVSCKRSLRGVDDCLNCVPSRVLITLLLIYTVSQKTSHLYNLL